jgi:hypothetical protein
MSASQDYPLVLPAVHSEGWHGRLMHEMGEDGVMRATGVVLGVLIAALMVCAGAAAAKPEKSTKATTVTLDSFTLSPQVKYADNNFWCEFNNYGAYFSNYVGLCPYQDYVATVHWKKVLHALYYNVCQAASFRGSGPGWACYAGDQTTLSKTFDSAAMFLNSSQGTTQMWMVEACEQPVGPGFKECSESNVVTAEIPWTG